MLIFFLRIHRRPTSTLFPYTTLFRSKARITCTVELTLNSTETFESNKSTLHSTATVSAMKLSPTFSKGEIYWSGEGDMKRSEEHTSELQSHSDLVCRLLLEKKN